MTALAGIVGRLQDDSHERICRAAIAAQRAYGTREPSFRCSADAAFGISLYDLLPEDRFDRQPLWDERFQLVADIRLDNRAGMLNLLGESTEAFRERSDADVLFLALRTLGEGCLDHLIGDFAFAFHDIRANRLVLARDPLGRRPLCYATRGDSVVFASMPSGLMAGRRSRLDLEAFALRLVALVPAGRTYFEDVASVKAGEVIAFEGNKAVRRSYWHPSSQARPPARDPEWTELFRDQLDAAVGPQLRSRSAVIASQLSSGYDSSAVTATAARLIAPGHRLVALTAAPSPGLDWLVSKNRIADESALASQTAAMHSIEHLVVRDPKPLLDPLLASTGLHQEPLPNLFNFGWWTATLHAARSKGASSMLSATMGNFTISYGGIDDLPYIIRAGHWLTWLREARAAARKNQNRWRGILMTSFEPWIPSFLTNALYRSFVGTPEESRFSFVRAPLAEEAHQSDSEDGSATWGDLAADRLSYLRRSDPGIHDKAMLAFTQVELRDPAGDRRLMEFCLSLPMDQLIHDGVYRPLARRALADRVPEAILDFPTRGFQGADWYARLRRADVLDILEEIAASHSACELLDIPKMRRAIDEWPCPRRDGYETVFAFGRNLTDALSTGIFIADVERSSLPA